MSYNVDKFSSFTTSSNPTAQSISTTYIEPTGSRVRLDFAATTANVYYKYSFYVAQASTDPFFLHCKLQKSNDNFSSDIEDISGLAFNFSGDVEAGTNDTLDQTVNAMFVITGLDKRHVRLMVRSYSTATAASLHRSSNWDASTSADVYYNPSLIAIEL
tara:strand:+ start:164 stop:640 length:477 start_codon:yes stop_codon:yes gene_type:complete